MLDGRHAVGQTLRMQPEALAKTRRQPESTDRLLSRSVGTDCHSCHSAFGLSSHHSHWAILGRLHFAGDEFLLTNPNTACTIREASVHTPQWCGFILECGSDSPGNKLTNVACGFTSKSSPGDDYISEGPQEESLFECAANTHSSDSGVHRMLIAFSNDGHEANSQPDTTSSMIDAILTKKELSNSSPQGVTAMATAVLAFGEVI